MEKYPSIFNDVIGAVMRGLQAPLAALRCASVGCLDLMDGDINEVHIKFDADNGILIL